MDVDDRVTALNIATGKPVVGAGTVFYISDMPAFESGDVLSKVLDILSTPDHVLVIERGRFPWHPMKLSLLRESTN